MYREGVSALIINEKDEFLLVNLEAFEEGNYAIPGGGLDEGESLEQAAYREVEEELNIQRSSLQLVGKGSNPLIFNFRAKMVRDGVEYIGSRRNFFGFKFVGTNNEISPRDNEVRTFVWAPFAQLDKYLKFDLQVEETTEQIKDIFPSFRV